MTAVVELVLIVMIVVLVARVNVANMIRIEQQVVLGSEHHRVSLLKSRRLFAFKITRPHPADSLIGLLQPL